MRVDPRTVMHRVPAAVPAVVERTRHLVLDQPARLGDSDCEAIRGEWWGQPVNTATSFSFIAVGFWATARLRDLDPGLRAGAAVYAVTVALNGIGSAAYHGPQFDGAQTLHDLPAVGTMALGVGVPLWRRLRGRRPLPGWSRRNALMLAGGTAMATAAYAGGRTSSRVCDPRSWVQLHGVWHISTALLMAMWASVLWPSAVRPSAVQPSAVQPGQADPDGDHG